jgi:hypothetical protein
MAEMERLYDNPEYEGGEPNLTGLDNAEQVREMARTVGAAAHEQAADFLELCGKGIEAHFTSLGITTFANKARRATVVRDWDWYIKVYGTSSPHGWFSCGVFISIPAHVRISVEKDVHGLVLPYLWLKDRHKGANEAWSILRDWPRSPAGVGLIEDNRTVVLACIPIKPQPPDSFDADREPLIAEVMTTIAQIGVEQTRAIASFAARVKESDES